MNTLEQQIDKILSKVIYDSPTDMVEVEEQLTNLIKQREKEAVEGFAKRSVARERIFLMIKHLVLFWSAVIVVGVCEIIYIPTKVIRI